MNIFTFKISDVKKTLFTILFAISGLMASAQMGWEAGGWLGVSYYFGDLNTNFNLTRPGLAGGLIGRWNFNERLCLKFGANYGSISAYDSDSSNSYERARNLSFKSNIFDGTAQFEFNFLPYIHGSKDQFYTPYLFTGFSIFYFNPKAEYNGEMVDLRPLGTEGQFKGEEYYTVTGALTYGVGFKIDLSYEWSLNFELSARRTFTDYLDDVSTLYPDMDDLESLRGQIAIDLSDRSMVGPNEVQIGQTGRQRGNKNSKDSYLMFGVGLVYYFGDIRCPPYTR